MGTRSRSTRSLVPLPVSSTMPSKNWIGGVTREQRRKDFHEAESSFEGVYPRPDHLNKPEYLNGVNVAVIGGSGQGKSSLICALLGITHDKTTAEAWNMLEVTNAAPKRGAAGETTQTAMPYSSVHLGSGVFLWDTPGAGTLKHPTESYIEEIGLKYFNGVLIVSQDRVTDVDLALMSHCRKHKIPHQFVRSKIDIALDADMIDNARPAEVTLANIREQLGQKGVGSPHLVTTRTHWWKQNIGTMHQLVEWINSFRPMQSKL